MSTNSKNVIMPSIPQPKSSPSLDAALREVHNIAGNRATAITTTSVAKRVAFRRSSTQSSSSPKNERAQGGDQPLAVSKTSTKKGANKKTRKNSKNSRLNTMNKGTIRLSKLTASSFNAASPSESDKRLSAKSVPLAYKKIMI